MNGGIIASRYAKALLEWGKERGAAEKLYRQTEILSASLLAEPEVGRSVCNPIVAGQKKIDLLVAASGGDVCDELKRFFELVIAHKRERFIHSMCLLYGDLYRKDKNLLSVDIVSAQPLADQVRERIILQTEKFTGGQVELNASTDADLIGGFVMQWDTYRVDASVAGELKRIEKNLKL